MNDFALRKVDTPSFSGQELTDTESGDEEDPDIPRVAQWVGESELLSDLGDESALENENDGVGVNKKELVRSVTLTYIFTAEPGRCREHFMMVREMIL